MSSGKKETIIWRSNGPNKQLESQNLKIPSLPTVSLRAQSIPEKVKISRPINMGFKGWGRLL